MAVRRIVFGACALAIAACSSSSKGSGVAVTVMGTIDGHAVATTDAVGVLQTLTPDGVTTTYAGVDITNIAGTCAIAMHGGDPANQAVLTVAVGVQGSTVPPGQYTISPSNPDVGVQYDTSNASCEGTFQNATSGTIGITAAGEGVIEGSFDVTFPTGETLTGTFSVPICDFDPDAQPDAAPECGS
ncbi:MAG: hypothetical protein ABSE49_12110 [Polyangiaceae bacterium]